MSSYKRSAPRCRRVSTGSMLLRIRTYREFATTNTNVILTSRAGAELAEHEAAREAARRGQVAAERDLEEAKLRHMAELEKIDVRVRRVVAAKEHDIQVGVDSLGLMGVGGGGRGGFYQLR